jgi:hypothetical protein
MALLFKKKYVNLLFLLAAPMLVQGANKINVDIEVPWRALFTKDCEARYRQEELEKDPSYRALDPEDQGKVRCDLFKEECDGIIENYLLDQAWKKLYLTFVVVPTAIVIFLFKDKTQTKFNYFVGLLPNFLKVPIIFFLTISFNILSTVLPGLMIMEWRKLLLIYRLYIHQEDFFTTKREVELLFMRAWPYLPEATRSYVIKKLKEVWIEPLTKWHNLDQITTLLHTTPNLSGAPKKLVYDRDKVNAFVQKYKPILREQLKNLIFKIIQTYNNPRQRLMVYIYGIPGTGKSYLEKEIFAFLGMERGLINLESYPDDFFGTSQTLSPLTLECARVMRETNIFACSFPDGDRFLNSEEGEYAGLVLKLFDAKELTYIDAFYNLELKLPRIVFVPGNSKKIRIAALASRFAYKIDFNSPYTLEGKKDILTKYFLRLVAEKADAPCHLTDDFLTPTIDSRLQELAEDEEVTIRKAVQLIHKLFMRELHEHHAEKAAGPPVLPPTYAQAA